MKSVLGNFYRHLAILIWSHWLWGNTTYLLTYLSLPYSIRQSLILSLSLYVHHIGLNVIQFRSVDYEKKKEEGSRTCSMDLVKGKKTLKRFSYFSSPEDAFEGISLTRWVPLKQTIPENIFEKILSPCCQSYKTFPQNYVVEKTWTQIKVMLLVSKN